MSELTPEQLQEFKVTFAHFDDDDDNKLSIHEFRAGCRGMCLVC
jgi:Ca2+-binding EF-hand superfamily protein